MSRLRDGAWFYPTIFESKIAPLTALGFVELRGKKHVISDGAGSSSGGSAEKMGERSRARLESVLCAQSGWGVM